MDIPRYLLEEKGIPLSGQQRQAVEAEGGEILLLAVPGAGKTTVLTARIAHLMANRQADPRRVLTLTFNKESAREMGSGGSGCSGAFFPGTLFSPPSTASAWGCSGTTPPAGAPRCRNCWRGRGRA